MAEEEKKVEAEEAQAETPAIDENGNVRLSGILIAALRFNRDPQDQGLCEAVQELINAIVVRERLTLMEKTVALVEIMNAIPEDAKDDAVDAAISLELARYFHGLFKYAANLNVDLNLSLLDTSVYDVLEAFGFSEYLLRFCAKDYEVLKDFVNDALNFRNIDKIVRVAALFSDENMKSFKETVQALKTELTPEKIAQMKALVAEGDPAWQALKETVTDAAVENALLQDVAALEGEGEGKE